jgi:hypothetical protein
MTSRDAENDIPSILDLGADDYLVKPFSARVNSLLRRAYPINTNAANEAFGEFEFDPITTQVGGKLSKLERELVKQGESIETGGGVADKRTATRRRNIDGAIAVLPGTLAQRDAIVAAVERRETLEAEVIRSQKEREQTPPITPQPSPPSSGKSPGVSS